MHLGLRQRDTIFETNVLFSDGIATDGDNLFGVEPVKILLDDMNCTGNENSIAECRHDRGIHNCHPYEVAGVICGLCF